MKRSSPLLLTLLLLSVAAPGQAPTVQVASHTALALQIDHNLPMRIGQPIRAELRYPVYSGASLVFAEKTIFAGSVVGLRSDRSQRVRSRFNLDFTPFRTPVVQFNQVILPGGAALPIATDEAIDGVSVVHLAVSPAMKREGFLHRQYDVTFKLVRDEIVFFTAPGKGDRLLQLFYHQLPWHPQRIEKGTAWTVETAEPLSLSQSALPVPPVDTRAAETASTPSADQLEPLTIQANLNEVLSSSTAQAGQTIRATVAEPVFDQHNALAIPQGSTLVGAITRVEASRKFGRSGIIRFSFRQIILPSGQKETIEANLIRADSASQQKLALDSEGDVKPQPQDKIIVPFLLLGLASAPLDPDPGDNDEFFKNAGASNSLGVAGFITGIAVNRAGISAGFGYYGAALSIIDRWIKHGTEITFPRDTRVILKTTAHRAASANTEVQFPSPGS